MVNSKTHTQQTVLGVSIFPCVQCTVSHYGQLPFNVSLLHKSNTIYEPSMCSALKKSSAIQCFKRGDIHGFTAHKLNPGCDALETHDEIIFSL